MVNPLMPRDRKSVNKNVKCRVVYMVVLIGDESGGDDDYIEFLKR